MPTDTPKLQNIAAKTVHYGMYICLAAIPISGLMIALVFWLDYKSGFLIETIVGIHEFLITLFYWLIAAHVLGALYHRLIKDGVWSSMVPIWKEESK